MNEMESYLEELHTRQSGGRGRKASQTKALVRWLRSVLKEPNVGSSVKKAAQRELKDLQGDAATQSKPSKEKDARNKRINLRGRGGGGGSIKSPDETARGRMSLLKKKM